MDAIRLFGELVAQRRKATARDYENYPAYHQLKKIGLIENIGVVQSLYCDDCDHPHDAAVVYESERYGYYCPDLGFVAKHRSEIAAVQANEAGFIKKLAVDLNCKRRKLSPIAGNTWRVGSIETHAGAISVYFHPVLLDASDLHDLETALALEMKSSFGVVLTASGFITAAPFPTITLENCFSLEQTSNQFRLDADIETIVGVPQFRSGGRPNIYKANIEKIMVVRSREGRSADGRNEEAKGVLAEYSTHFPKASIPSKSVVNDYVTKIRSGLKLD